jgi:predicted metal-dependent enzyme (double-stranded beta helix superfamily)
VSLDRINLDDFVLEMMRTQIKDLRIDALRDLFLHLDLREILINECVHFCPTKYARNLVCRTPRFDMLVLCWQPGQQTTIHDHAGSLNVTRVYSGTLTSRTFEAYDRPGPGRVLVRPQDEEQLGKSSVSCVDYKDIHQLANTSNDKLVTVHIYARPLKDITVYEPDSGEAKRMTVRYSLEEELI